VIVVCKKPFTFDVKALSLLFSNKHLLPQLTFILQYYVIFIKLFKEPYFNIYHCCYFTSSFAKKACCVWYI